VQPANRHVLPASRGEQQVIPGKQPSDHLHLPPNLLLLQANSGLQPLFHDVQRYCRHELQGNFIENNCR